MSSKIAWSMAACAGRSREPRPCSTSVRYPHPANGRLSDAGGRRKRPNGSIRSERWWQNTSVSEDDCLRNVGHTQIDWVAVYAKWCLVGIVGWAVVLLKVPCYRAVAIKTGDEAARSCALPERGG